jgi:hypothetical protein
MSYHTNEVQVASVSVLGKEYLTDRLLFLQAWQAFSAFMLLNTSGTNY